MDLLGGGGKATGKQLQRTCPEKICTLPYQIMLDPSLVKIPKFYLLLPLKYQHFYCLLIFRPPIKTLLEHFCYLSVRMLLLELVTICRHQNEFLSYHLIHRCFSNFEQVREITERTQPPVISLIFLSAQNYEMPWRNCVCVMSMLISNLLLCIFYRILIKFMTMESH